MFSCNPQFLRFQPEFCAFGAGVLRNENCIGMKATVKPAALVLCDTEIETKPSKKQAHEGGT